MAHGNNCETETHFQTIITTFMRMIAMALENGR